MQQQFTLFFGGKDIGNALPKETSLKLPYPLEGCKIALLVTDANIEFVGQVKVKSFSPKTAIKTLPQRATL